jgi:hypothetical protein
MIGVQTLVLVGTITRHIRKLERTLQMFNEQAEGFRKHHLMPLAMAAKEYGQSRLRNAKTTLSETIKKMRKGLRDEESIIILASIQRQLDQLNSEFVELVNKIKKRIGRGDPEFISAMDTILSKLTSGGEFGEVGDAQNEVLKLVEEWIPIFILLYEPVASLLMSAWGGFKTGILGQGAAASVFLCLGFLFRSNIPRQMDLDFVMAVHAIGSKKVFVRYFFSDEPMGKDPFHALELVLGELVFSLSYMTTSTYISAVWTHSRKPGFWPRFLGLWLRYLLVFVFVVVLIGLSLYKGYQYLTVPESRGKVFFCLRTLAQIFSHIFSFTWKLFRVVLRFSWGALGWCRRTITSYLSRPHTHWYSYSKLNPKTKEIRLLKLSRAVPLAEPTCELLVYPLHKAPEYDAISYTWDGQERDRILKLKNGNLLATKNVIRIIEKRASCIETKWLWIDAVCINQENLEEKGSQLILMGQIYKSAARVVAWLDYEDVPFLDLMGIHLLNRHMAKDYFGMVSQAFYRPGLAGSIIRRVWLARVRLLGQRYWGRGWIVQEIALGKIVHLRYGGQFIRWETWEECFPMLDSGLPHLRFLKNRTANVALAAVEAEKSISNQTYETTQGNITALRAIQGLLRTGQDVSLDHLLSLTSEFKTSEPEDKIYSLLSMANWTPVNIMPDYTMPVHTLYRNVAQSLLESNADFVLRRAGIGYPRKVPNLPSWVPDWSTTPPLGTMNILMQQGLGDYHSGFPLKYAFSETPIIDVAADVITFYGLGVSEILEFSPPVLIPRLNDVNSIWETMGSGAPLYQAFYDGAEKIINDLPALYPFTNQTSAEAFWRTLIGDRWFSPPLSTTAASVLSSALTFPAPADIGKKFTCLKAVLAELLSFARGPVLKSAKTDFISLFIAQYAAAKRFNAKTPAGFDDSCEFVSHSAIAVAGKRFARTRDGHICLVPHMVEKGDRIVVVRGVRQPLVLRKGSEAESKELGCGLWRLVGCCYVHGFMAGEAFKDDAALEGEQYLVH